MHPSSQMSGPVSLRDRAAWKGLALLERRFRKRDFECHFSPLFIIGPPRAGTTLVRQVVTWSIPCSFFTNLTQLTAKHASDVLPVASALAVKYARLDRYEETFSSEYGYSPGLGKPAGASTAWWRLMGVRYDPIGPGELSARQRAATHRAVAATENIFNRPFVNKTSAHSVCIKALADIFDHAIFIRVLRDPLDVAQSIYKARTRGPKPRHWIGGRPPEAESTAGWSVEAQSCAQVHYLEQLISSDLGDLNPSRVMTIRYEDICRQPKTEVLRVCEFMSRNGNPAEPRRSLPRSFPCSEGIRVRDHEFGVMKETFQALQSSSGGAHGKSMKELGDGTLARL